MIQKRENTPCSHQSLPFSLAAASTSIFSVSSGDVPDNNFNVFFQLIFLPTTLDVYFGYTLCPLSVSTQREEITLPCNLLTSDFGTVLQPFFCEHPTFRYCFNNVLSNLFPPWTSSTKYGMRSLNMNSPSRVHNSFPDFFWWFETWLTSCKHLTQHTPGMITRRQFKDGYHLLGTLTDCVQSPPHAGMSYASSSGLCVDVFGRVSIENILFVLFISRSVDTIVLIMSLFMRTFMLRLCLRFRSVLGMLSPRSHAPFFGGWLVVQVSCLGLLKSFTTFCAVVTL